MHNDLNTIDPDWAWSPYQPDADGWTSDHVAHLYRRAGFAATAAQIDAALPQSPVDVVRQFLIPADEDAAHRAEIQSLAEAVLATGKPRQLSAWWAYRMLTTPQQLHEKTTLFWHGHFSTSAEKVDDSELMYDQYQLLRSHALGDFGSLVQRISRDPAMLIYLDSATNRKAHPNENYAREIMELFCLGEGNYTEEDIRELARCFTGWEIKRDKYRFNRYQHDFGKKTIFNRTGEFGGEEGANIVLDQDAAPHFIVTKLIHYFLFDEPAATPALIEPLARQFRENGMQTGPIVERMLASNLCFSPHSMGRKVRSPVELVIGFLRALEGSTNTFQLAEFTAKLGQSLFYPPNVKGWDGGRAWINSSTLLGRANTIRALLDSEQTRFAGGSLTELMAAHGVRTPAEIVAHWQTLLFAVPIPADVRRQIERQIDEGHGDREQRLRNALHLMCTLPEFQLA